MNSSTRHIVSSERTCSAYVSGSDTLPAEWHLELPDFSSEQIGY